MITRKKNLDKGYTQKLRDLAIIIRKQHDYSNQWNKPAKWYHLYKYNPSKIPQGPETHNYCQVRNIILYGPKKINLERILTILTDNPSKS